MNKKIFGHFFIVLKNAFFNAKDKIYICLLNKFIAKEDEYYGLIEPSVEWMILHNKRFWIQPCNEEENE